MPDVLKVIVSIRIMFLSLFLGLGMIGAQAQVLDKNKGHNWPHFVGNTVASMGVAFVSKTALKVIVNEERPDRSDNKSFPSGHTAIAFAAARSIDKEFCKESIWIPIAGYAAATVLGVERVASNRHHWYDVAAGAAIGYGAAELTWYLSDKLFGRSSKFSVSTTGQSLDVVYNF
jgi:membrane-associated phospholipid phosphatase